MKKRTFLYLPALILFIFAISVLVVHFSRMSERYRDSFREVRMPFTYDNGKVLSLLPESRETGIKQGDRILTINGRMLDSNQVWNEELSKSGEGG